MADADLYCQRFGKRFNFVRMSNDPSIKFPAPFRMSAADLAALPEVLRYDVPPDIKMVVPVIYPYEQLGDSIDGEASVDFLVDPTGRVQQIKAISATQEAFGLALEASLTAWKFKPATRKGEPSWSTQAKDKRLAWSAITGIELAVRSADEGWQGNRCAGDDGDAVLANCHRQDCRQQGLHRLATFLATTVLPKFCGEL